MARSQLRMAKRRQSADRVTIILIAAFVVFAVVTAILAFTVVRNLVNSWNITSVGSGPQLSDTSNNGNITIPNLPGKAPSTALQPVGGPTPEPWDGASRVNILIMGLDYRDWQSGDIPRTDTMILFTLDPVSNTAGMLSIPRDMWVNIPGFDYAKINTAYYLGEVYKLPGGGPGLAIKTVEQFLGVPIQFYAQVDFEAFVKFIDDIGGVDINVPEEMVVDPLGPGNTVTLRPGVQTLDGATALGFARTRHIEGDDFTRARNQQLLIMSIRKSVLALNMMPTLIAKAPKIYQDISAGVHTNMSFQQMMQMAISASKVDTRAIKKAVIGTNAVSFGTSPDGLAILIPIPDKVRLVRDSIFTVSGPIAPVAEANVDPAKLVAQEKARIIIQNGTQTAGLASKTADYFRSQGMNVVQETNADRVYDQTNLIVQSGKPYSLKFLATNMAVASANIFNRFDPNASADIIVVLGNDWARKNPMP